jgi:hypothetical protein
VIGGLVAGLIAILALGRFYPGSGGDVLDWKPTRSPEVETQNELDDIEQMLAAQNELRRKRGLPERSEDEFSDEVRREQRELDERAARFRAEHEPPPHEEWRGS